MHEFAVRCSDARRIGTDLGQAIASDPRQRGADGDVRRERDFSGAQGLARRAARECVAALGLAGLRHGDRQVRCQRQRQRVQNARLALDQLEFDLSQRRAPAAGSDLAVIQAKHGSRPVSEGQRVLGAIDVRHEYGPQVTGGFVEHIVPWRRRQFLRVDARVGSRPFIFRSAVQRADALSRALDRLHPALPAPAHAQGDPGFAQILCPGVVVRADGLAPVRLSVKHGCHGGMLAYLCQRLRDPSSV